MRRKVGSALTSGKFFKINPPLLSPLEKSSFDDAICLYTTQEDVHALNMQEIQALNEPCAQIAAKHDGGAQAAKASADDAGGLESFLLLSRCAKVMITRNLWQEHGEFFMTILEIVLILDIQV
jgi:hypothetical protein